MHEHSTRTTNRWQANSRSEPNLLQVHGLLRSDRLTLRVITLVAEPLPSELPGLQFGQLLVILPDHLAKLRERPFHVFLAIHDPVEMGAIGFRPSGEPSRWHNPNTGNAGAITPTRTDRSAGGIYCREYQLTVTAGGRTE